MQAPIQVLTILFPIWLPANMLGKAIEDSTTAWVTAAIAETQRSSWLLNVTGLNSSHCGLLGGESVDGMTYLYANLSVLLTFKFINYDDIK